MLLETLKSWILFHSSSSQWLREFVNRWGWFCSPSWILFSRKVSWKFHSHFCRKLSIFTTFSEFARRLRKCQPESCFAVIGCFCFRAKFSSFEFLWRSSSKDAKRWKESSSFEYQPPLGQVFVLFLHWRHLRGISCLPNGTPKLPWFLFWVTNAALSSSLITSHSYLVADDGCELTKTLIWFSFRSLDETRTPTKESNSGTFQGNTRLHDRHP